MADIYSLPIGATSASHRSGPSAPTPETDIYLLAAHPNWRESKINLPMMQAAKQISGVQVQDLYSTYPDYLIDIEREHAALAKAKMVVLMHPIHWYSMPALQKLWIDEVLTHGWAYGEGGTMLKDKAVWLVLTTGSTAESYSPEGHNRYSFEAFLPPYEQTFALCGMRFLPPLIFHGAHTRNPEKAAAHVATFEQRLRAYAVAGGN